MSAATSLVDAWNRASALAVVLDSTSTPANVAGLGAAWAQCIRGWREIGSKFPYCVLAVSKQTPCNKPTTILARDADALRQAAAILGVRFAGELILWCNCGSVATWDIVAEALAQEMATEGTA